MLRAVAFAVGLTLTAAACTPMQKDEALACGLALAATGQTDPQVLWMAATMVPACQALKAEVILALIERLAKR